MNIAGKKAVVIGGASGLGRATAEALAARGADVAILDQADTGGERFYPVEVTDFSATEAVLQQAVTDLGGLHIAVTTAGGGATLGGRTYGDDGPHDLDSFRAVIVLNTVATFNISRLAAMHMSRNTPEDDERGVIINTASLAAYGGQPGLVAYSAAKAAIAGMCLTMARDLGDLGIRVLAIAPSLFASGMTAGVPDDIATKLTVGAAFPHRLGRPDEFARLAVAIVDNPMLNGQCIRLDAGVRR